MHYLFSNYMLGRYEEVIEFYNVIVLNEEFLRETSIIIIILSAFKANKMNQVKSLIEKNKESKNINLFLKAIESISANSKNDLDLSSIDNTIYLIKLAETLKY